jgi:type IV secretory pathway VirB2 component (pilin)
MSVSSWVLSLLSILGSMGLVWMHPEARAQAASLSFPLTQLGESVTGMIFPITLSVLATSFCFLAWMAPQTRWGVVVTSISWLLIGLILGREGLGYLF